MFVKNLRVKICACHKGLMVTFLFNSLVSQDTEREQ